MREIRFRAWYENKMCYNICVADERTILKLWHSSFNAIDCSDIMQYTWLKDKNGKEIYEGDIVEYGIEWGYWNNDYTIKRTVEYKEWHYNPFIHWHEEFTQKTYPECCEVIGNIYENPELVTI